MHVFTASFHRSGVNRSFARSALVHHEQTGCLAVTKLVWTAVILNGSEGRGPLTSGRALKMYITGRCIKSFEAKRGGRGSNETPGTPLPTGLIIYMFLV